MSMQPSDTSGGVALSASPQRPALGWNFYRYLSGFGLSAFGDSVSLLAITFAVLDLTQSAQALGVVLIAGRLPVIAFVLFGGVAGDRWSRRHVMMAADLTRLVAQGILAMLLIFQEAQLWQVVALHLMTGVASAFFMPASAGLVRDIVAAESLQRANGLLNLVRNSAAMVALGVSAWLIARLGTGYALAVDSLTFAASAALIFTIRTAVDSRMTPGVGLLAQLAEGRDYLRQHKWLLVTVIHGGIVNGCVIAPVLVLGPLVAKTHLAGASSWAAIGIATTTGALIGSLLGLRWRPTRLLAGGISVVIGACPMIVLLALAAPTEWLVASAVLFGMQSSIYLTATSTVLQQQVPGALVARMSGYFSLGSLVLMPVGLALSGMAAERFGTGPVLWAAAAALLAGTLAALAVAQVRAVRSPA